MNNRIYINDFCEDLNHRSVVIYIGNVDAFRLLKALEKSQVNKCWRLDYVLTDSDPSKRNFMYIENCDLQNLDYPVHEMIEDEGYDIYILHENQGRSGHIKLCRERGDIG